MKNEKHNNKNIKNIVNISNFCDIKKLQNMVHNKLEEKQNNFTDVEMHLIYDNYYKLKEKIEQNEIYHIRIDTIKSLIDDIFNIFRVYYENNSFISLYDKISDIAELLCNEKFRDEVSEIYTKNSNSDIKAYRHFLNSYIKLKNLVEQYSISISSLNKKNIYKLIKLYIDIIYEYMDKKNKIKSDNDIVIEKSSNIKSDANINIISELFEYMMCEFINNSDVFNKECTATITSLFDDFFNGVDCVLEFNTKFNNKTFNGISFDITITSDKNILSKKFNNIKLRIISGLLPCIKYYISPNDLRNMKLENIPKTVFSITNKDAFFNILDDINNLKLFETNRNINYEFNFLYQIYLQLVGFKRYAQQLNIYIQNELNKQDKIYLNELTIKNINKLLSYLKENNQNEVCDNIKNTISKLSKNEILNNIQTYLKELLHTIYKIKHNSNLDSSIHNICDLLILDIKKVINIKNNFTHPLKKICNEKDLQEIHKIYKEHYSLNNNTFDTSFKYVYNIEYYKERYESIIDAYQKSIDTFTYIIVKKINTIITKKNKNPDELKILHCILNVLHNDKFKDIKNSNILFNISTIKTFGVYDKYKEQLEIFILEFLDKIMQTGLYNDINSILSIKSILEDLKIRN